MVIQSSQESKIASLQSKILRWIEANKGLKKDETVPTASGSLDFWVGSSWFIFSPLLSCPTVQLLLARLRLGNDLPSLLHCLCFFYILNSPILPLSLNFAFALKLSPLSFPLNLLKPVSLSRASQVAILVKNPPAMQEPQRRIQSLDWEGPLQRSMAPTVAFFPGGSPWTEEPGGLQSTGRKDSDTTEVA